MRIIADDVIREAEKTTGCRWNGSRDDMARVLGAISQRASDALNHVALLEALLEKQHENYESSNR
jgi:Mg2+ and Co2+ transporter CorA